MDWFSRQRGNVRQLDAKSQSGSPGTTVGKEDITASDGLMRRGMKETTLHKSG